MGDVDDCRHEGVEAERANAFWLSKPDVLDIVEEGHAGLANGRTLSEEQVRSRYGVHQPGSGVQGEST